MTAELRSTCTQNTVDAGHFLIHVWKCGCVLRCCSSCFGFHLATLHLLLMERVAAAACSDISEGDCSITGSSMRRMAPAVVELHLECSGPAAWLFKWVKHCAVVL
jgi:hypothetical protein